MFDGSVLEVFGVGVRVGVRVGVDVLIGLIFDVLRGEY